MIDLRDQLHKSPKPISGYLSGAFVESPNSEEIAVVDPSTEERIAKRTGFGGYKQSGLGREGAKGSQAMFTEMKATIIAREPRKMPRMGLAS